MCGITLIWGGDVAEAHTRVEAMTRALAHRGPDGRGVLALPAGAMGHVRLSILDLSDRSRQPFVGRGGSALTFNGEVYNYRALRADAGLPGVDVMPDSDTAVVAALLEARGSQALRELRGMFALAFWSARDGSVLLARDRFGIKPLYYAERGGVLYVASEIKALLTQLGTPRANLGAVTDFLARRRVDAGGGETLFEGVRQLPAGHYAELRPGESCVRPVRFASLDQPQGEYGQITTRDDAVQRVASALRDSVKHHRVSDVPVGALVSGGLDSSGLAYLSHDAAGGPVPVFSSLTPTRSPEVALMARVHRDVGGPVVCSRSGPDDIEREFLSVLYHQDEPFADGSMIAHYMLMREIRRAGIKVVLSGQGADELFGGYSLHRDAAAADDVREMDLRALGELVSGAAHPAPARVLADLLGERGPIGYARRLRAPAWLSAPADAAYRDVLAHEHPAQGLFQNILQGLERTTVPGFLHYEDRNSMAHGVEVRVPYLDVAVLGAAVSVPAGLHFEGAFGKALLRRALSPPMPTRIAWQRVKCPYPSALDAWLAKRAPGVGRWVLRYAPATGWFAPRSLHHLAAEFARGPSGPVALAMWRIFVATAWHRLFLEGSLRPDDSITAELDAA